MSRVDELAAFQARLGYTFLDPRLLELALTHPSYMNEHGRDVRNDDGQFAFLGDAVLSLAVAVDLLGRPGGKGALTKARAERVKNERLASLGRALAPPLALGKGESQNPAGEATRFANGVEAVLGAVYLDAGPAHAIQVANALIKRHGPLAEP